MTKYYLANDNQRLGPFDVNELLQNGLVPDSLVWCKGMTDWKKAMDVPELEPLMSSILLQQPNQSLPSQNTKLQPPPYKKYSYQQQYPQQQQSPYQQHYPQQQYGQYPQQYPSYGYNPTPAVPQENSKNKYGLIGFILAISSFVILLIPPLNLISPLTWLAGLVLSIVGVTKKPRGLAVAGIIISLSGIVILVAFAFGFLYGFMFLWPFDSFLGLDF